MVFDSGFNPLGTEFLLSGLSPSLLYRFEVKARDINGLGTSSPQASFVACLSPAALAAPVLLGVSQSSFEVSWLQPGCDGGCSLTEYSLWLSDDQDTATPTYALLEAGLAPTLLEKLITFPDQARTGKVLRLKVQAANQMGTVRSPALQFVLASVPGKPSPPPSVDPAGTTTSTLKVLFVNANPDLGGVASCTYQLEMDDGDSGEFRAIFVSRQETSYSVEEGVERGKYYRFRYRAQNVIGYSEYSDVSYIQAVDSPTKPGPPRFVGAGDDSITISIAESADSRGVDVASYEIWVDEGNDMASDFSMLAGPGSYDGVSPTYTLSAAVDGLGAPGTLYRIKVRARNSDGVPSDDSEVLVVALGSVPAGPSSPVKDVVASGAGQIAVHWEPLAGGTLPLLGYRLYSDLGLDHDFHLVFDGRNKPSVTHFLLSNVTGPLVTYKFYVAAVNFNGEGAASPTAMLRACTLPSAGAGSFPAPGIVGVSSSEVAISWVSPASDGGCQVLGYALYVDDGDGVFLEYDAGDVRGKPFLSTYVIDMAALAKAAGQTYLIRVGAENSIGEVESDTVSVLLASVPDTPEPPVKQVLNNTHVEIVMSPPASDGGAMITSYQLQLKMEPAQESWSTVLGEAGTLNLDLVYELPISSAGLLIQARYRCANEIGWSGYSLANSLLLARQPSPPARPLYLSSDATSITIEVLPSVDNGGSDITAHEVWRESGGVLVQDTTYDGSSATHVFAGLTSGEVYRAAVRSLNGVAYSEWSAYLEVAASSLPPAPAPGSVRKVAPGSSKTSIQLEWDKVPDAQVGTTGYLLWMALNTRGSEDFVLIMNGTNRPERNDFPVKGLLAGRQYRFKL